MYQGCYFWGSWGSPGFQAYIVKVFLKEIPFPKEYEISTFDDYNMSESEACNLLVEAGKDY